TKAKRIRSLLARQPAFKGERPPWVTALVFLSSPELDCRLRDIARTAVCGRDLDPVLPGASDPQPRTASARLPGILAGRTAPPSRTRVPGGAGPAPRRDRPTARPGAGGTGSRPTIRASRGRGAARPVGARRSGRPRPRWSYRARTPVGRGDRLRPFPEGDPPG